LLKQRLFFACASEGLWPFNLVPIIEANYHELSVRIACLSGTCVP